MSEKKSHGIQLLIQTVVKEPGGKVISDTGQKPAKSFVIQFLEFIYGIAKAVGNVTATDVNGAEENLYFATGLANIHLRIDAPVNNSDYGIVIGTGDTGETNTNYKLETQLTEGVGAGNITHGAMDKVATAEVGANVDLELKRSFINNTGSAILVKEAGIYTKFVSTLKYHCIIRDVLPAPVNVPDKCSLTVYYTLRTTV